MKNILLVPNDDRMTGIVPSLITHRDIHTLGEDIDQFSLAFITPLGTDDD